MFDNIGCKIKSLVKTVFAIEIILFVVIGILLSRTPIGIIIAMIGIFIAWISSFALYGYGELIETSQLQSMQNEKILSLLQSNLGNKQYEEDGTKNNITCIKHMEQSGFDVMKIDD